MRLNSLTKKSVILGTVLSICACAVPTYCVLASGKKNCNNSNSKVQQTTLEKESQCNAFKVKREREDGVIELELSDANNQNCDISESQAQKEGSEKESSGNVYHVKSKNEDGTFELEEPESKEALTIKTVK